MFDGFAGAVSSGDARAGFSALPGPHYQEADSVTWVRSVSDAAALLGPVVTSMQRQHFSVAADSTSGTVWWHRTTSWELTRKADAHHTFRARALIREPL